MSNPGADLHGSFSLLKSAEVREHQAGAVSARAESGARAEFCGGLRAGETVTAADGIYCGLRAGYTAELAGCVGEPSLDTIGTPDGYCSGFCRLLLSPLGEMSC
jgi:hypothetical protein